MAQSNTRKGETIRVRTSSEIKNLLKKAATSRGQTLSDFMLNAALRKVEETFLDQSSFILNAEDHDCFLALLDTPPNLSDAAHRRLTRPVPWKREAPQLPPNP